MTVTTEHTYTGNNSTTSYAYTFPYYQTSDIKVTWDGVLKTESTHYNVSGTNIVFTSGNTPGNGVVIHIYRETDVDTSKATFAPGSSIRATDLNNQGTQLLYAAQEVQGQELRTADIKDAAITTAKIANLAVDSNKLAANAVVSGVVANNAIIADKIAANAVTSGKIADNAITQAKLADDAIGSAEIATGAVIADGLASNAVTTAKIATGAVTADEIGSSAVTTAKIDNSAVTAAKIGTDAVTTAKILDANVTTNKIANDAVTVDKLADNSVDSQHYVDGSIETAHISDNAITAAKFGNNTVTNAKMADNSVGTAELVDDAVTRAKIADSQINSEHYADGSIDVEHLSIDSVSTEKIVNANVTTAKLAADAVTNAKIANDSIDSEHYVDGSIDTAHIADDAITSAKIAAKTITNAFIADDTITSALMANDAIATAFIENNAVTTAKIADDAINGAKIADSVIQSNHYADGSIDVEHLSADSVSTDKIVDNAVTTAKIADAELTTLAGMQSGTASILASGTTLTSSLAELNLLDGKSVVTAVSGSSNDNQLPTAKAVNDQIVALMQDAGGYFPIADDQSFPNTNPDPNDDAGTIVSIADAGGLVVNGSGVTTTGRTLGGATVTINGIDSSLYSTTIAAGKGMLVQTTSTLNTYTYHRLVVDEAGVAAAQTLVSDFNQRYRVGSSNPTSSLDDGDLFFNTSSDKMLVYNATDSSWDEVQSVGNFYIATFSEAFDGSRTAFTVSNAPTSAQQLLISINGVVQKPNAGTGAPSEGFTLSSSTVTFSSAPATGSDSFIVVLGSTVNIGTPSDNTVDADILQNGAVTTTKIADDAITGDKLANNLDIPDSNKIRFGTGNDLQIYHDGTNTYIKHVTAGAVYIDTTTNLNLRVNSSETAILANGNGSVELRYDDVKKFETYSSGVEVHGTLQMDDNKIARFGNDGDLQIYHSGSHSHVSDRGGSGNLQIESNNAVAIKQNDNESYCAKFFIGAGSELYHNNSKKFETKSDGVDITGELQCDSLDVDGAAEFTGADVTFYGASTNAYWDQSTNRFTFEDNTLAAFGSGQDLAIYHDGSNSYLGNATGDIIIENSGGNTSNQIYIRGKTGENSIGVHGNGQVELYYDNVKKFETYASGTLTTGNLKNTGSVYVGNQVDGHDGNSTGQLFFGAGNDLKLYHDGTQNLIEGTVPLYIKGSPIVLYKGGSTEKYFEGVADAEVKLYHNGVKKFETTSSGVQVTGYVIASGNIYTDKILTNTTTNSATLYISGRDAAGNENNFIKAQCAGGVELNYNTYKKLETKSNGVRVSSSADTELEIKSTGQDGAPSILFVSDNGDNNDDNWRIRADGSGNALGIQNFADAAWEANVVCRESGGTELYYDNSKKFETKSYGANMPDNSQLYFGTGDDLVIKHDGTDSRIINAGSDLYLYTTGSHDVKILADSQNAVVCQPNASVQLYYDNAKKLETQTGGIKVNNGAGGSVYLNMSASGGSSGYLYGGANQIGLLSEDQEWHVKCVKNAGVELLYDNTAKLETRSGDVLIKDNLRLQDGSSVLVGTGDDIQLYHNSGVNYWKNQGSTVFNMVDTGGDKQIEASNNGAVELYHNGSGKIITTSSGVTVTGSVTETSDIALKTDIEPIDNVLDKIQQITGYTYKFKDTGHDSIGVTAQDVEKVFPELVHGEEGTKSLQYSGLIGALIESVKELSKKVAALEAS